MKTTTIYIKKHRDRILLFALIFVFVTINFPKHNINNIALFFLSICWAFSIKNLQSFKLIFRNRIIKSYAFFIVLYIIGLTYSNNFSAGLKVINHLLPLFLVPIVFLSIQNRITKKGKKLLKLAIIYATALYCLYTLIAVYFSFGPVTEVVPNSLFDKYSHSNLTIKIDNHPTYLSYTIIICVLFVFDLLKKQQISMFISSLILVFFWGYMFLLSSKIGIIILGFTFLYLLHSHFRLRQIIVLDIVIILSFLYMFSFTDFSKRFYYEINTLKHINNLKDKSVPVSEKNQRLIAVDIFMNHTLKEHMIGLGTGNLQNHLDKKYRYYLETKNRNAFKGLNYHNQYFQTIGEVGILGLFLLLFPIYLVYKVAKSRKQFLYIKFIIITLCFFAIESFFETQRGVMLYACFNSFFFFLDKD